MFLIKNALIFALLITGAIGSISMIDASKKMNFKKDYYEVLILVCCVFIGLFCGIYGLFRFISLLDQVIPDSIK